MYSFDDPQQILKLIVWGVPWLLITVLAFLTLSFPCCFSEGEISFISTMLRGGRILRNRHIFRDRQRIASALMDRSKNTSTNPTRHQPKAVPLSWIYSNLQLAFCFLSPPQYGACLSCTPAPLLLHSATTYRYTEWTKRFNELEQYKQKHGHW